MKQGPFGKNHINMKVGNRLAPKKQNGKEEKKY